MKNLLNSPTDGNMSMTGNPVQSINGGAGNTSFYGSLSGPDTNGSTYRQAYSSSSKSGCGCNGAKQNRANMVPQQMNNYSNTMPAPPQNQTTPFPKNMMTGPNSAGTTGMPPAYPSAINKAKNTQ